MKTLNGLIVLLAGILFFGCASTHLVRQKVGDNIVLDDGQEEYELIIIDPGFQTWFASRAKPINYYSLSYYESQNKRYVSTWNELFSAYGGRSPFENRIDYEFNKNYGLELNYQLFWCFKYIESLYGGIYRFPS